MGLKASSSNVKQQVALKCPDGAELGSASVHQEAEKPVLGNTLTQTTPNTYL